MTEDKGKSNLGKWVAIPLCALFILIAEVPLIPSVFAQATLQIRKNVGTHPPTTNKHYVIEVKGDNNQGITGSVTVTDVIPSSLTIAAIHDVGSGWTCNVFGNTVTCNRTDYPADNQFKPVVTIDVCGTGSAVDNTAQVYVNGTPHDTNKVNAAIPACAPVCGNGQKESGEDCDDGNTQNGDCCSSTCQYETGSCNDGNACTQTDTCQSGACVGSNPLVCNDNNACTDDSCDPAAGCVFTNKTNGTDCNADSNGCTQNDSCQNGVCVRGSPPNCDDGLSCTTDTCQSTDANSYVCKHPIQSGSCLINGACYASGQSNPQNECQACNPGESQTSFTNKANGTACNADSDGCTQNDSCQNGVCVRGSPPNCDDGLSCTTDTCQSTDANSYVCKHPIQSGSCLINGACYASGQSNPQNECQVCDPGQFQTSFTNKANGTACTDDGKTCTDDVCSNGSCSHPLKSAGTPCHPGDDCQASEECTGQSPDCPFPDNDGDGVRNACDSCPTTPGGMCQNLMTVGAVSFSLTSGQASRTEGLGEALETANNMGVLVTDYANDLVWVYLGKGDGRFQRFRFYAAGQGPIALAVGDINQDGKTDWVAANYLSSTLSVALGNGDGTFGRVSTLSLNEGENPSSLAMGDFNGDGRLDVAVANFVSNNVTVLLGRGDGRFHEALSIPLLGQGPSAIVTADFNLDGALDLAVTNMLSNEVSLLFGDGKGTFGEVERIPVGEAPVALAVADFNRDGRPDLVAANFNGDGLSLLLSRSGVSRSLIFTRTEISLSENPVALVTGEFVRETPGIATVHLSLGEVSLVHVQQGQVVQRNVRRMSVMTPNPTSLTPGDFNNDGLLDVVVVGSPLGELTTLLGKGDGTFILKR